MGKLGRDSHRHGNGARGVAIAAAAAAVLAAALPATAATRAPATGTVYGGSTSKHAPFAVTLSSDRRRLAQALFYVDARCDDGTEIPYFARAGFSGRAARPSSRDTFDRVRLGQSGTFSARGVAVRARGGLTLRITHEIRGTIRGSKGGGTFKTTMQAVAAGGTQRETCSTRTLAWKARSAPGHVFAGATASGGPVVVELSATRRKISAFRVGWASACATGAFFGLADELSAIDVSREGSFRDSLQQDEPIDGGGKRTVAIALSGRAGRAAINGTYRHTETDRNAAGKTVETCDSRALRWRARSS